MVALGTALVIGGHQPAVATLAAPFFVVVFCKLGRLYDRDEVVIRKSTLDQAPDLVEAATIYTLIFWLASDLFVSGGFGKAEAAAMWGVLTLGLILFRCVARRVAATTSTPERVLVLGSAEAAERLRCRIETAHSINAVLVGRVHSSATTATNPRRSARSTTSTTCCARTASSG